MREYQVLVAAEDWLTESEVKGAIETALEYDTPYIVLLELEEV